MRRRLDPLTPLLRTLRIGASGDIWHKPATSAVVTLSAVNLTLLALGRLDLALYTSTGALCALYGHNLPYRARARTLGLVALGTLASTGLALTAAAVTDSVAVLVAVTALLAALHKMLCDAARIGRPAISSSPSPPPPAPSSRSGSARSLGTSRSPRVEPRWPGWSAWCRRWSGPSDRSGSPSPGPWRRPPACSAPRRRRCARAPAPCWPAP
ncbi:MULTISPECIES: hypothetical protein [unclassified Kitasatospora]|uniref:hypothetical protein n=1 Tax=unclassified Kitasatospora TaxID=2633591 RepID=UPI0032B00C80